jgi:hypothetical protein
MIAKHPAAFASGSIQPSLRSLLFAAYAADPRDRLISPMGEHGYATLFGIIPVALAVLRAAAKVEPNPGEVIAWYRKVHIAELGNLTAEQLVSMGRAEFVIAFLQSIRDGCRD